MYLFHDGSPPGSFKPPGECCDGTLDAAGRCCPHGALDACGVCGGNGTSCHLAVLLAADLVTPDTNDAAAVQQRGVDYVLQGLRLPPSAVNATSVQMPGASDFGAAPGVNASSIAAADGAGPRPVGWVRVVLQAAPNASDVLHSADVAVVLAALDGVSTQVLEYKHLGCSSSTCSSTLYLYRP